MRSETAIQQDFVYVMRFMAKTNSDYHVIAIPNGGKRPKRTAITMKKEGVQAGAWDLILLTPKHGFGGLWLECKTHKKGSVVKENQREFYELHKHKYQFSVFRDPKVGVELVREYLKNGFGNYGGGTGIESKLLQIPPPRKDEIGFEQLSWF